MPESGNSETPETAPERWLLAVARDGDRAAFAALYRHFAPRVKSYAMRLGLDTGAAEELVQDVMLTVWQRAATYDPALAGAATWIFTITRNRRIDRLRRERRPEFDPEDPALVPDPAVPADSAVAAAQEAARLRRALKTLSAPQSEVLRLAYFEEKSHSTIAAERDIPLGTVKTRVRAALAHLRRSIEEQV
ncbi:sigma-70 family RNA polymerase sigma factor [Azospirillum halopraeferens]|uniref:sigma-70 family RNA polymerase sigma factor n=1 Tax=Azospirillum halopraeferens TaxID=34010 RepID=UPI00040540B6|nr:sigma-70 family RNA polymerase sigma factor [Azospirillum halopraeferens]